MREFIDNLFIVYGGLVMAGAVLLVAVLLCTAVPILVNIPMPEKAPELETTVDVNSELYRNRCLSCGTLFRSTRPGDVTKCPNCPSSMCPYGSDLVLQLAGVIGPSMPPAGSERDAKYQQLLKQLESHATTCDGCRKELNAER